MIVYPQAGLIETRSQQGARPFSETNEGTCLTGCCVALMCQTEDVRASKTKTTSCYVGERDYLDSITLA